MRVALLIALKDLRQRVRDRSALILGVAVPFALAAILGLTLSDVGDARTFDLALVDDDHGAVAVGVTRALGDLQHAGVITLRRPRSVAAARRLVSRGDVAAAFLL